MANSPYCSGACSLWGEVNKNNNKPHPTERAARSDRKSTLHSVQQTVGALVLALEHQEVSLDGDC